MCLLLCSCKSMPCLPGRLQPETSKDIRIKQRLCLFGISNWLVSRTSITLVPRDLEYRWDPDRHRIEPLDKKNSKLHNPC